MACQYGDDELPKETIGRFIAWCVELPRAGRNTKYFSVLIEHLELHMFGHFSRDVFSAVAFLRTKVTYPSGEIKTSLHAPWSRPAWHPFEGNDRVIIGISGRSPRCMLKRKSVES